MKIKNDFSTILKSYFSKHLTIERKFSSNTYTTYLMVIKQFIAYLKDIKKKKAIDISINDFTKENILSFLEHMESLNNISPKTRNHKLAVINSFLEYAQSINPVYMQIYLSSKSIKNKKVVKEKMDFMTIDELKSFFKAINLNHKSGYKHYVILTVLYETGARVSELINLTVKDCFLNESNPYIKILGKGNKVRLVYINSSVVKMINEYLDKLNISEGILFRNHSDEPLTRDGINKIIKKYYDIAKKECPTLERKRVSPHTFRHSKAVHFLQNNTALPIIQRFLGHSSIQTTEIYLDITNEVVIDAVKLAANIIDDTKTEAVWSNDNKLLDILESLSK